MRPQGFLISKMVKKRNTLVFNACIVLTKIQIRHLALHQSAHAAKSLHWQATARHFFALCFFILPTREHAKPSKG